MDINIANDIKVDITDTASLVTWRLSHLTMLKHFTYILPQDATTLWLYYIKFIVAFDKLALNTYILLSKYFFVNGDFGPFMPQIYKA
jgi:hypothetical protein